MDDDGSGSECIDVINLMLKFALIHQKHLIGICLQLCAGLEHMHSLDPPYAHNDVKPGNVLLTHRKGQPPLAILMDFGSARPARKQIRSRTEALQLQVLVFFSAFVFPVSISFSLSAYVMWSTCLKVHHAFLLYLIDLRDLTIPPPQKPKSSLVCVCWLFDHVSLLIEIEARIPEPFLVNLKILCMAQALDSNHVQKIYYNLEAKGYTCWWEDTGYPLFVCSFAMLTNECMPVNKSKLI